MMNDELLPLLPHLLETKPELFSHQDLQDLNSTINLLATKSNEEAEAILANFYRNHPHIRDTLRRLSQIREIKNLAPSSSKQSGIRNVFPQISKLIKDTQEKRNLDNEPKTDDNKS